MLAHRLAHLCCAERETEAERWGPGWVTGHNGPRLKARPQALAPQPRELGFPGALRPGWSVSEPPLLPLAQHDWISRHESLCFWGAERWPAVPPKPIPPRKALSWRGAPPQSSLSLRLPLRAPGSTLAPSHSGPRVALSAAPKARWP